MFCQKLYQLPLRISCEGKLDSLLSEEWKENVYRNNQPGKAHVLILGFHKPDAAFSIKKRKEKEVRNGGREGKSEAEKERGRKGKRHSWLGTMDMRKPYASIICYFQSQWTKSPTSYSELRFRVCLYSENHVDSTVNNFA